MAPGQELVAQGYTCDSHNRDPLVEWTQQLEDPGDFDMHATDVVPPLNAQGIYLIAASLTPGFETRDNRLDAEILTISPIVLLTSHGTVITKFKCFRG